MDNATKCKCGAPSVTRNGIGMMAADLAEDLARPEAALLVELHAGSALRLARYLAGECLDCVHGTAADKAVA